MEEERSSPLGPLVMSQRKAEGTWLHFEMRLCVSILGTGIRGICALSNLSQRQRGAGGAGEMHGSYCSVPFTGKEGSSQQ